MEQDTLGAAFTAAPEILRDPAALPQEGERRPRRRRVRALTVVALLLAVISAAGLAFVARQTPWYAEWQYARLSLAELEAEGAGGNGENNPRLLYYLGRRLNEQQRYAQADPILRRAVGLDPHAPRLRDEWARALLGSGLTTAAFGQLREFAGTHPDSALAHLLLGKFYFTQNSMKRASEELERAVSLNPSLADGWAYLAGAADALGDAKRARAAAEKAVALRPKHAPDRLILAGFLAASGDAAAAHREYDAAVRLGPNNPAVHREYARWLLSSGGVGEKAVQAEEHARRAVTLDPADPAAQLVLGRTLAQRGDDASAAPILSRAAALAPHEPAPALTLAQTLRRLGRANEARVWEAAYLVRQKNKTEEGRLRDQIRVAPEARGPRLAMARLLARRGDVAGCVRQHAAARRVALDAPAALIAAANDLTDVGRPALALPLAQRAIKVSRASPMAHEALGNALLALNNVREAAASYDKTATWLPGRFPVLQEKLRRHFAQRARVAAEAENAFRAAVRQERTQVGPQRVTSNVERLARRAVTLQPNEARYWRYLLQVQMALRKNDAAIQTANRLLALAPNDAQAHVLLALLLVDRASDPADLGVVEQHLKIAETDPNLEPAWRYGRGLLALKRRQAAEAVRELSASARLDPSADVTYYKLAAAQDLAGNAPEARRALGIFRRRQNEKRLQASVLGDIAQHPDQPDRYARAAQVFAAQGLPEQAAAIRAEAQRRFGRRSRSARSTAAAPRPASGR